MTVAHEETPTRQINIPGMKHVLIVCQYLAAAFSRCKLTRGVCMHFSRPIPIGIYRKRSARKANYGLLHCVVLGNLHDNLFYKSVDSEIKLPRATCCCAVDRRL